MAETSQTDGAPNRPEDDAPAEDFGPRQAHPPTQSPADDEFEHAPNYEPSVDKQQWHTIRNGMALWLGSLAAMMWVFLKVMKLYAKAESGKWVSLKDLRATGATGTAVFCVCLLLGGAFAYAVAALMKGDKRHRRAGLALALASGLPLVLWMLLLIEASRGVNPLGLR